MKQLVYLFIIVFAFTACNESSESDSSSSDTTEQTTAPTPDEPATPAVNPPHGEPGHVHEEGGATPPAETSGDAVPTDGSVKLNPAHGEPGHSCDIPVGAPLPN